MREIKFRAWSETYEEMFDVDVLAINSVTWDSSGTGVSLAYQPNVKVMQYTGLKDKNGVEIYEGDVVHAHTTESDEWVSAEITGVIEYFDNSYCIKSIKSKIINSLWTNAETFEIIGNIYENPELQDER